ncbi:MAG: SDR family NAD(P)-dependent oxidoreductase [Kineosporiaceae bacterium]
MTTQTQPELTPRPLALVTGASSGIGLELAKQFAERGFDLLIAAETSDITLAAEELRALGAQVETSVVDLRTFDGVERLVDDVRGAQTGGRTLEAVAINAGVGAGGSFAGTGRGDATEKTTALRDELDIIDLNITSSVHLAKRVVPQLVEQGHGRVLFTSSIAATMPGPYEAVYAASKAFVQSFSQALRYELKDSGVTVTTVLPGPTDTDFFERGDLMDTKVGQGHKDDPAEVAQQAVEALLDGKDQVVGGATKNKVQAAGARLMSDQKKAAMHARLAEPKA